MKVLQLTSQFREIKGSPLMFATFYCLFECFDGS